MQLWTGSWVVIGSAVDWQLGGDWCSCGLAVGWRLVQLRTGSWVVVGAAGRRPPWRPSSAERRVTSRHVSSRLAPLQTNHGPLFILALQMTRVRGTATLRPPGARSREPETADGDTEAAGSTEPGAGNRGGSTEPGAGNRRRRY